MKLLMCLIVALGMGFTGLVNPDQLRNVSAQARALLDSAAPKTPKAATDQDIPIVGERSAQAPHPALAAQAQAMKLYPGLARTDSAMNRTFVSLYQEAKASNPELLSQPNWPLQLADQAMLALGGTPVAETAIPSLASFGSSTDSALDAPSRTVARVNGRYYPYYYPSYSSYYYYYGNGSTVSSGQPPVVRSQGSSSSSCVTTSPSRGTGSRGNPLVLGSGVPYRSRLETNANGSNSGRFSAGSSTGGPGTASRGSSQSASFTYRNPTASTSRPSPVRCNPAPRAATSSSTSSSSSSSGSFGAR